MVSASPLSALHLLLRRINTNSCQLTARTRISAQARVFETILRGDGDEDDFDSVGIEV